MEKHPNQDTNTHGKTKGKRCRACLREGKPGYIILNEDKHMWICDQGDSRHNVAEAVKK